MQPPAGTRTPRAARPGRSSSTARPDRPPGSRRPGRRWSRRTSRPRRSSYAELREPSGRAAEQDRRGPALAAADVQGEVGHGPAGTAGHRRGRVDAIEDGRELRGRPLELGQVVAIGRGRSQADTSDKELDFADQSVAERDRGRSSGSGSGRCRRPGSLLDHPVAEHQPLHHLGLAPAGVEARPVVLAQGPAALSAVPSASWIWAVGEYIARNASRSCAAYAECSRPTTRAAGGVAVAAARRPPGKRRRPGQVQPSGAGWVAGSAGVAGVAGAAEVRGRGCGLVCRRAGVAATLAAG